MRTFRRKESGKPAAALAIITTIFAVAIVIKLLPPATREVLLPMTAGNLPSRALTIWTPEQSPVSAVPLPAPALPQAAVREVVVTRMAAPSLEIAGDVPLAFDRDPGLAPILQATTFMPVALVTEVVAAPAEIELETGNSPLVMPFAKTGSALRFAFAKTGSAIKAAASGTAGVFVSNP